MKEKKKAVPIIIAIIFVAAVVVFILVMASDNLKEESKSVEKIETVDLIEMADMVVYTYEELKERADAIVKVKVKDELTKENSVYKAAEPKAYNNNGDTGWCYSLREVEVLEIYRGAEDWNVGDTVKIQDACAIIPEEGRWFLYVFDEYEPPEKDTTYLLFLENGTGSGKPAIINYGNGSVNLDEPEKNPYPDIAKAAIEEFVD